MSKTYGTGRASTHSFPSLAGKKKRVSSTGKEKSFPIISQAPRFPQASSLLILSVSKLFPLIIFRFQVKSFLDRLNFFGHLSEKYDFGSIFCRCMDKERPF